MVVVELDQADVPLAAGPAPRQIDVDHIVTLAVQHENGDADVRPPVALRVDGERLLVEAEVDTCTALLDIVLDLEPARVAPAPKAVLTEPGAPALGESERGRQQHQGTDARIAFGNACSRETSEARSE